MDAALTQVLENPYGKLLGYYPPVYVINKCFEFSRPYFLEFMDENGCEKGINSSKLFYGNGHMNNDEYDNDTCNSPAENNEKETQHQEEVKSKKKKTLNWFFSKSEKEKPEEYKAPVEIKASADDLFYPCDGSDIDEDDDSDVEGEYTFHHSDSDEADAISVGAGSIRSEKELTEKYEKELKIKLVENFVNDDTKKSFNKRGSIKKLFTRTLSGKKK